MRDLVRDAFHRYDANQTGLGRSSGVPTGIEGLDLYTGGLPPGSLTILAARPSVGKSALALLIAVNAARRGLPVLVFSHEMTEAECTDRIVAMAADVPLPRLRGQARMEPAQIERVYAQQSDGVGGMPLFIDDRCAQTATQLATIARRHIRRKGTKLIVVDYLQLLRPDNQREQRHLQVGQSAKRLKELAKETGTAVLCLAQLWPSSTGRSRTGVTDALGFQTSATRARSSRTRTSRS
jgi:replicative DNA helicase